MYLVSLYSHVKCTCTIAVAVSAGYLAVTTHCTVTVAVSAGYLAVTTHCTVAVAVSAGYLAVTPRNSRPHSCDIKHVPSSGPTNNRRYRKKN